MKTSTSKKSNTDEKTLVKEDVDVAKFVDGVAQAMSAATEEKYVN